MNQSRRLACIGMAGMLTPAFDPKWNELRRYRSQHRQKFHINILVWCHSMHNYLEVINRQHLNELGFSAVGSTLIRHLQYGRTTHSNCPTPTGLPETLYDPEWLESTDEGYCKVTFSVLRDKFEWLMFNSEDTEMMV